MRETDIEPIGPYEPVEPDGTKINRDERVNITKNQTTQRDEDEKA